MKSKLIITLQILVFFASCSPQFDTVNPQISSNIRESRINNVFVKKYKIARSSDNNIIVEEMWLERSWFYNDAGKKLIKNYCHLCFKLKQSPALQYKIDSMGTWDMFYKAGDSYVGYHYGQYSLNFNSCIVPDTIELELYRKEDDGYDIKRTRTGTLILRAMKE